MKKLEIPDGSSLLVVKATNRKERHGKTKVQGITLRVEWWPHSNEALNMLSPGLQDSVFFAPPQESAQEKLDAVPQALTHLRVPGMWPQKAPMVEFAGYTMEIEHGIDETTALTLYECKLDKFEVDAKEGGACSMRFNVGSSQQITPELLGQLCAKEGLEVKLVRLTPPAMKVDPQPTDNGAPLFEQDPRDAGTVLAENEAAGKNKPASEVPKPRKPRATGKPSLKVVENEGAAA